MDSSTQSSFSCQIPNWFWIWPLRSFSKLLQSEWTCPFLHGSVAWISTTTLLRDWLVWEEIMLCFSIREKVLWAFSHNGLSANVNSLPLPFHQHLQKLTEQKCTEQHFTLMLRVLALPLSRYYMKNIYRKVQKNHPRSAWALNPHWGLI